MNKKHQFLARPNPTHYKKKIGPKPNPRVDTTHVHIWEHTPKRFAVDERMQITALCNTFFITRRRHELYTYSKWELLLGRLL